MFCLIWNIILEIIRFRRKVVSNVHWPVTAVILHKPQVTKVILEKLRLALTFHNKLNLALY